MSPDEALTHVAKLVAGRDKTVSQVRQALERKGCAPDVIAATVQRAKTLGYLDDARVAVRFATDALRDGWVGEALQGRLEAKGVEPKVLEHAIDEARLAVGFDDMASARRLLAKKKAVGAKAARFLASRGYSHELIERLVGTLGADG